MKRPSLFLCSILLVLFCSGTAGAALFYFDSPQPADLYDLSHGYHYAWGMTWDIGELTIDNASLTLNNIRNWSWCPENDLLRIYLLDSPPSLGTSVYPDTQGSGDDIIGKLEWGPEFFATWTDPDDRWSSDTLTFTLNESQLNVLNSFVSNDNTFGIAFDPDCHYYNCGIEFNARAVPEPAAMLLLGSGLIGLAGFKRKLSPSIRKFDDEFTHSGLSAE
jgi:hypothetical protein